MTRTHTRPDTRWTARCFVIGPNLRWTQVDYEDLQREYPEVFLGYSVWLLTPEMISRGMGWGVQMGWPGKIVLLHGLLGFRPAWEDSYTEQIDMWKALGAKIETWYVQRGYGIWRMDK